MFSYFVHNVLILCFDEWGTDSSCENLISVDKLEI